MATREGYAQIAWRMSAFPELATTRTFRALNLQNLLYLQAELNDLEEAIHRQEQIDRESQSEKQRWNARSWKTLKNGAQTAGGDGEKWRLFCEMREKLKEYNAALEYQTRLSRMTKPRKHDLEVLRQCITDVHTSDYLLGKEEETWTDPAKSSDLIAISPVETFDPLTQWLADTFLAVYHRVLGHKHKTASDPDADLYTYDDDHIRFPIAALSTALASALPIVAVVVLYFVTSMRWRLGIVAFFTSSFSLALSILTQASRTENFAATAAFTAVLVVFIGTHGPGSS